MSDSLPIVYLTRHGETVWSLTGQHTGLTDLLLTERGERNAQRLGERLKKLTFAKVFTSPLPGASRTCELAGFGPVAEVDTDLVEWGYGQFEPRATGHHAMSPCVNLVRRFSSRCHPEERAMERTLAESGRPHGILGHSVRDQRLAFPQAVNKWGDHDSTER